MPETQKVTVLLADSDAMRRDGLAAVLRANPDFDIVAGCADGEETLEEIRELLPQVAVIDLNLPGLHGIELVRRVRGEELGTKIIILAGTMDDEIVREVVRAGADGYLLKNGPARHLTDAINYVRDGGQYFSPQMGRDGRDRHLLQEPPRIPSDSEYRGDERRRRPRTADPERFRERIREEAPRNLRDRDYDIMSEMADGIRPILERLDEIENRVVEMEQGEEPVPADPRRWLDEELTDTLSGSRRPQGVAGSSRMSARDMEARLPQLIEEAVTKRFQTMAGKLQEQVEEQHVRTLETFVKNIQVKLVQRVSVLEQNMNQQAEAMLQLREYNQRTEDNLSRLISGVDKLATELPKRLAAARAEQDVDTDSTNDAIASKEVISRVGNEKSSREKTSRENSQRGGRPGNGSPTGNLLTKLFWAAALLIGAGGGYYWVHARNSGSDAVPSVAKEAQATVGNAPASAPKVAPPASTADTKTKLEAAKQYLDRKEYITAEDIYRQVVQAEPKNEEALKGLASVLYRENKLEESAAVMDQMSKN